MSDKRFVIVFKRSNENHTLSPSTSVGPDSSVSSQNRRYLNGMDWLRNHGCMVCIGYYCINNSLPAEMNEVIYFRVVELNFTYIQY